MYSPVSNKLAKDDSFLKLSDITFFAIMCIVSAVLYYCLVKSTAVPLVAIAIPLCLFDRSYMFPMLLTVTLCQGAFQSAEVTVNTATQNTSYAETLIVALLAPILFYDLTQQKSKMVPYRFVIFYVIFFIIVYQGIFIYYQHPENYLHLPVTSARKAAVFRSIIKSIKIVFYVFYLKVLVNYPVEKNIKTLDLTRRFVPFIFIVLAVNLLLHGRVQNGVGYTGTVQLGDAHHGSFTSQLCALGIYCFITLFMRKVSLVTRGFAIAGIAAIAVSIMMMGSRNGLLSFFILGCIGLFINLKNKSLDFKFLIVFLAAIAAGITITLSLNSPTVQRAIYMTEAEGGGERIYYWEAGVKALSDNPIFGLGGDETASQGAIARLAPSAVEDKIMHNTYMEMAVEYGLIGLVFYLVFLFFILTWGYRLYKYAIQKGNLLIAAPPISYLILMIAATFISDIWDTSIWYNLSMILALSVQLIYYDYIDKRNINTKLSLGQALSQQYS